MMSGIRKAPPISISSPRDTGTSFRRAKLFNVRSTAAALLLTTSARSAPVNSHNRPSGLLVSVPAFSGDGVEFQIAGTLGDFSHRLDGTIRQSGPPQVGVQNRTGQVDDPA